ncbi:F0F1 ATP synthase subunit delta [Alkalicoccus chagannorensis]|uniref:F0F1 ATP synthase subunit delta n=1 Tax=Alkalicoccus chagannorensis TaxID=427072 RepID=UPI0003F816F3|nr:F0F1 ATP synthase subunit delta [Alkalicoccus chagannorensis]
MRRHPVGFRYASALFESVQAGGKLDETLDDLNMVSQAVQETNLLDEVFQHPDMTDRRKKEILDQAFQGKVSQITVNLLKVLVDNKRESIFEAVRENFKDLVYEAKGIAEAEVYSAKPLTEQEKAAVSQVFAKRSGRAELLINNQVDKDVIGGLRVRIGDTVYDGTVANHLVRIHERMNQGTSR